MDSDGRFDDFVVITRTPWNEPWRTRHYVAAELSKKHRVLFVESSQLLLGMAFLKQFLRNGLSLVKKQNNYLLVLSPFHLFPGRLPGILETANSLLYLMLLKHYLQKHNFRSPVIILFDFRAHNLLSKIHHSKSIYYCNDAFSEMEESALVRDKLRQVEFTCAKKVDLVVGVCQGLCDNFTKVAKRCYVSPHGVINELIDASDLQVPEDMLDIPHPILGFIGYINHRLDWELLLAAAQRLNKSSFVFIGPVQQMSIEEERTRQKVRDLPNVYYLGSKPSALLKHYIACFDIALLPMITSGKHDYRSKYGPNQKFFQYMALKKPVLSTPMQTLRPYSDWVMIASNVDEFVAAVENPTKPVGACLSSVTWEKRMERLLQVINSL